jgi:transcriptional regulator with XRE-family HTH domain
VSTFQRAREALGLRLRELRLDARLTGRQLAVAAGWHATKVSKIENARVTPSITDVETWARACGKPEASADLAESLRNLESYYIEHRRLFRAGLAPRQRAWVQFEAETDELRNFENVFIPGLLQTMPYARLRLAEGQVRAGGAPDDLDDAVATRMQRQQVLYRPDKRFHFVVTEAALRYRLGPPDVLIGQLDRLIASLSLPNLRLGVVPFAAELPLPPVHGFHLLDRAVIVETMTSSLTLTEEAELAEYRTIFDRFAQVATYGRDARDVIAQAQADLVG